MSYFCIAFADVCSTACLLESSRGKSASGMGCHGQRFRTIQNLIYVLTYNSNLYMNEYNLVHNRSTKPTKSLKQLVHVEQVSIIPSLTYIIESWLNNYSTIVYWYTMVHKGSRRFTMVHKGSQRFTKVHKGSQRFTI
jgi:hypothetical protein